MCSQSISNANQSICILCMGSFSIARKWTNNEQLSKNASVGHRVLLLDAAARGWIAVPHHSVDIGCSFFLVILPYSIVVIFVLFIVHVNIRWHFVVDWCTK